MTLREETAEGWAAVSGAEKRHYFLADRRSLCGRWACFGAFDPDPKPSKFDCAGCAKKAAKRRNVGEAASK